MSSAAPNNDNHLIQIPTISPKPTTISVLTDRVIQNETDGKVNPACPKNAIKKGLMPLSTENLSVLVNKKHRPLQIRKITSGFFKINQFDMNL